MRGRRIEGISESTMITIQDLYNILENKIANEVQKTLIRNNFPPQIADRMCAAIDGHEKAELVNSGAYEVAAGSCYTIFRCLAKTCKENEDWFAGFTGYGDTYTKLAIFTEAVVELYCHLRQKSDLSKRMADEMDINLEVFNLETDFFGDLHCSSRWTDMLCDAQTQYGDYSELDECPMWGMWEKKGGNDKGPTEKRRERWLLKKNRIRLRH